jgi:hypothetical protein
MPDIACDVGWINKAGLGYGSVLSFSAVILRKKIRKIHFAQVSDFFTFPSALISGSPFRRHSICLGCK